MYRYIVKRALFMLPTLLAIILIVFGIMSLTPGSPAEIILGPKATQESITQLNHELGFDKPFILRYVDYVVKLFKGDMGESYRNGRPVLSEIMTRMPVTAKLAIYGMLFSILIGVPLGIISAVKQYSIFDVLGTVSAMAMASVPGFWLGLMCILLFSLKLGWLPSNGSDTWRHFIMPSFTLAVGSAATILRLTRTTMLETIRQDYVRTARSKGQTEQKIILNHALKNSLLPVITVAGMNFGFLLGGAIVCEAVFSINGIGTLVVDAIRMKDIPQVTGCAITLSLFFMIIMLFVDILYSYIDPRIKAKYMKSL